jgi:nicotinate dehydrogenase subunit B
MSDLPVAAPVLPPDIASNPLLSRWVRVADDGCIEVYAGKVELGQGIGTTQLQIAADELDVKPSAIRLCVGDTALCPDQGLTVGSNSTQVGAMALRRVCAEVRQLFLEAAARRLSVAVSTVRVADGRFCAAAGAPSVGYLDLVADVDLNRPARGDVAPKPPAKRRVAGTSVQRPDLLRKLFGAGFIHDMEWPGMLHGRVVRPPFPVARLRAVSAAALQVVRALPGVHTLHIDGRYIAVAAEREDQAIAASAAMQEVLEWSDGNGESLPALATDQSWLRTLPSDHSVVDAAGAGVDESSIAQRFEADYSRPFLAHASMGPSCALARWDGGHLTLCSHTQGSFALRRELARFFDIDPQQVTVTHADGAGCFGHNGADDAAIDAAILARAAGRPVRLQWSREDELAWSPFGSAMSVRIAADLDEKGRIVFWQHDGWSYSHLQRPGQVPELTCLAATLRELPAPSAMLRDAPLPAGGGQRNALPIYSLPSRRINYHLVKTPMLRTSALRSLGAYANVFAIESAMDEMAKLCGQDPLAFRLAHLDDARAAAVLQAAAAAADWRDAKAPARREGAVRGRGLALARYKNSGAYFAVVVEIEVGEQIFLDSAWAAVDAGEVVNPDGVVNQIEGGMLQAASWTLKEAVRWDRAGVTSRSWNDYPILSFDETPSVLEVQVIAHPDLPALGVGECAAGPTAAAIANALADALGVRARHLPLTPERLRDAIATP